MNETFEPSPSEPRQALAWVGPDGVFYDVNNQGFTHAEFARMLGADTDGLIQEGWARVHPNESGGKVFVEGPHDPSMGMLEALEDIMLAGPRTKMQFGRDEIIQEDDDGGTIESELHYFGEVSVESLEASGESFADAARKAMVPRWGKKAAFPKEWPEPITAFMQAFWDQTVDEGFRQNHRIYNNETIMEVRPWSKSLTDPNTWVVRLNWIQAMEPGQGQATRAMEWLTALADEYGVFIELEAKPTGEPKIPKKKLMDFYGEQGFEKSHEKYTHPGDMVRNPLQEETMKKAEQAANIEPNTSYNFTGEPVIQLSPEDSDEDDANKDNATSVRFQTEAAMDDSKVGNLFAHDWDLGPSWELVEADGKSRLVKKDITALDKAPESKHTFKAGQTLMRHSDILPEEVVVRECLGDYQYKVQSNLDGKVLVLGEDQLYNPAQEEGLFDEPCIGVQDLPGLFD